MTWSDALKSAVGGLVNEAEQKALPALLQQVLGTEGLQGILARLEQAGLGAQVKSWIDQNKQNIPITADQVREALGSEYVQQIAAKLGISPDTIASVLAQILPQAVNAAGSAAAPPTTPSAA